MLAVIGAVTAGSFLLALVVSQPILWVLVGLSAVALIGYVALLRWLVIAPSMHRPVEPAVTRDRTPTPALTNVRFLPQAPPPPQFVLRQSASS